MRKIYLFTFMMLLLVHLKGQAQQITLHVERAGTLPGMIDESRLPYITDLKLTGELNGTDIKFIRTLTQENLRFLDLSEAQIVEGGNPYTISSSVQITSSVHYYTRNNIIGVLMFCIEDRRKPSVISKIILPKSTLEIQFRAFSGCTNLTNIDIPNSVTSIGTETFSDCTSLTDINIPNSVTSIESGTFYNCTSLTDINIPNSVTSIESGTFNSCTSLTDINIPNSVTSIGSQAFYNCTSLTDINIPNLVTSIEDQTFYCCTSLTDINIPNSVKSIGSETFYRCTSLTDINIPNSVTSIEYGTFNYCTSLTDINIPNSVKSIGSWAFNGCTSLTDINIPDAVTSIGSKAFSGCTSLTNINIPNSVTNIGSKAFYDCDNLRSVYMNASTPPSIGDQAFHKSSKDLTIYIPRGSYSAYWISYWGNYNLVEYDPTDIQGVTTSAHNGAEKYFSIDGRPLPGPCKGVNIIQDTDGKTRKAWIP